MNALNVEDLLGALAHERRDRGGVSATSLNVIAFVENDDRLLQWMAETSDAFAEAHGFRIVLLDGSRTPESHSVRTHCREMGETLVTSLEQIQLGVSGMGAQELRSVVHGLLVPNVQNVLLWGGSHVGDERFSKLAELTERVVLFSSSSDKALESLRELTRLERTPLAERIRDLAYMRLLSWQDLTAQFFDEPDLIQELPSLTAIDITSGSDPEAYYLAAWLAGRLGWEPCGDLQFCNTAGDGIRVNFHKEGLPRRIRSIRLHSKSCTFGIAISPDAEDLICLTVEGDKARPMRCVPLHDVDIVSLVERAIFSNTDGGVYLDTLDVLRRLFESKQA
ncbi:MAG TPA: glucose-6-phosphate dehydrogenase assembly protein OpcA [Candidatus Baltobacteraceae bacterium]|nr:glucose-6-phosphate dehydrogenase assembly protein OpcA [Candidatus Baltobacteraceae bacterium]